MTAEVKKLSWPAPPLVELHCDEPSYQASIHIDNGWHVIWSNDDTLLQTKITKGPAYAKVSYNGGCEKSFDIHIDNLPDLTSIPSFDTQKLAAGASLPLKVQLNKSEWSIRWSPKSAVSCDTCFETDVIVKKNTEITIELMHESGCTYRTIFEVEVEDNAVILPNVFAPSSHGENSTLQIKLPLGYQLLDLSIYDRWGNKVYSSQNVNALWDGKTNGQTVQAGVYVYLLKYQDANGKVVVKNGDLTVF